MKEGERTMELRPKSNEPLDVMSLNSIEIDTIGEILNISMGAAATAVSILLNRQVNITTPNVQVIRGSEFEFTELEPVLGIEIKYVQGLIGSNQMVMSVKDVNAIVQLLLGDDGIEVGLDEIHISALGEVMNQMMGASCTALASFLDREINISPPIPFEIEEVNEKLLWSGNQDYIVAVGFKLTIEELVDSEFFTVMTVPFARELVSSAMGMSESDAPAMDLDEPQIIGHTQVPSPVYGEQYKAEAKPIPSSYAASAQQMPAPAPAVHAAPLYQPPSAHSYSHTPAPHQVPHQQSHHAAPAMPVSAPRQAPQKNVVVKPLQFSNLDNDGGFGEETDAVNLGLVMGVDLNVTVEIGRAKKQVKEILALRQGSIVELDKQAGAPVDILVNGKLIARGDVVVIDDNFGVRITEIVQAAPQR